MIRRAMRAAALAVVATAALVAVPAAGAAPADLTSVSQANRIVSASWTLPPGATAWVLEVSVDDTFGPNSLRLSADLGATDTAFTALQPLGGGTYHVRVVSTATPDACVIAAPSCVFEFSNVRTVSIPSQAATLQTVTQAGGVVSATWTLPAGAESWVAEISTSPTRDEFGFFDAVLFPALEATQTRFTAPIPLPPGTYYVHVVTTPTPDLCIVDDPLCVFEFSNVVSVIVPAPPAPPPPPPPPPPSPPPPPPASVSAPDKVLALGAVTASSSQDVDKLGITLNPGEAVKVKLSGSVNVPGASKVFRFRTVDRSLGAGRTKLTLKLSRKAKQAVKAALRRKRKLKAKLTLIVTDGAGNSRTSKYSVRLKP